MENSHNPPIIYPRYLIFCFALSSLLHVKNRKSRSAVYCVKWKEGDWKNLLWGSFFSRIPSTPSDFILKKKPPFLQYSLLGSLKFPGGKPLLPPSSGVAGSVVIPPVAIRVRDVVSFLRSAAVHRGLSPPANCCLYPLTLLHTNWFCLTSEVSLLERPPSQGSKCPLSPENLKQ